jgi:kumamolisin
LAEEKVILKGSERRPIPNSEQVGAPDPAELITVSLILRRKADPPAYEEEPFTREEYARQFGAREADVPPIEKFAAENDLTVIEVDLARRTVVLAGSIANMSEAFSTQLRLYRCNHGVFRSRTGVLLIPADLADVVEAVFGLDDRPQAQARFRRNAVIGPRAAGDTSYPPNGVAKLYDFPTGSGAGQTVAIIELGGGYRTADLNTYFKGLGITTPSVTAVGVDGASNQPVGDPNSADGEVLLDIEVVGAIAPGAKMVVYFGPNTDQGFLDAITTAVHDTVHKPSVVSISWGGPESTWTAQSLTQFDQAFQDAAAMGVTVCCASGDDGSSDGVTDGAAHVDFPASSPNVLGCGGTRLESSGSQVTKEVVWNAGSGNGASGGGVSETFPVPAYQANAKVPVSVNPSRFKGRGVPDVSGDADPATGYQIYVDGRSAVFGGTSAVAPLWAALIALINQATGKPAGRVNNRLYAAATGSALVDITSGNNGAYKAGKGWDACTGLGRPDGQALLTALRGGSTRPTPPPRPRPRSARAY